MVDRVKHIDIAKGISITLVAMFHGQLRFFFPEIIEPMALFRLPLFFLLSGVFFSWAASPKDFFNKKIRGYVKAIFYRTPLSFFD
jgi:fucose 4-O-acetylase-like acetyltransferase